MKMIVRVLFVWAAVASLTAVAGEGLYRFDFEDASMAGWMFAKGDKSFRNEAGVGRNGSRALVWEQTATNAIRPLVKIPIPKFTPGMIVEAECWVKAEGDLDGECPSYDIEWRDVEGHWAGGAGPQWGIFPPKTKRELAQYLNDRPEQDAHGWTKLVFRTPRMASDAVVADLQFFAPRESGGRVLFDDVAIRVFREDHVVCFASSAYQGRAADGRVTFAAGICRDPKDAVRAEIGFAGADGKMRTYRCTDIGNARASVTVPVADFAMGTQKVAFRLFSSKGRSLGEAGVYFTRLATPDRRKVSLDAAGRCRVDGRPFFPLGMFWHEDTHRKRPELLDHYAAGPFNCLQDYAADLTPSDLDAFWEKGLRVIPSLIRFYGKEPEDAKMLYLSAYKGVASQADEMRLLGEYVNRLKDHPALLAWYVCDEMPERWTPRFQTHYEVVRALDPEHPQFACFCKKAISGPMINCYDVMGLDIYSISAKGCAEAFRKPDQGDVWTSTQSGIVARESALGLRPMWQVPQAFSWRWDYPEHAYLRFPTLKEFRAMCWQHVAAGANGLVMYAYGQMVDREWGTPEFDRDWKTVTTVAAEVKAQIPVLLKDPGPKPTSIAAKTVVRTWRDGASVYALVCNTHPEARKGEVSIPGAGDISRILIDGGVTFESGKLVLDMPPFGVALLEMKRSAGSDARYQAHKVRNTALEPRAKIEDDSYDWFARHEQIVKIQTALDPKIVFIGDSITHGFEKDDDLRGNAKAVFEKWFGKYRPLNMGFGWDRIQNVLWRLDHGEMDGTSPKAVVILIGTNNTAPGYKKPFPANTADEIADGIAEVCRRVREKAPAARIVLMDLLPRGAKASSGRRDVERVNAALGSRVSALSDANLVRLNLWNEFVGAEGDIPRKLMFDGLHPTAEGYEIWAAALMQRCGLTLGE